ncbi:hypothetical protein Cgig2_000328 [Carnegiea gigantea]|uniref:Uncharacterized protein n=1 Tax=Carnegiea gigantea TaxID=171969 RepID=A0A9Q1GZJ6_9CARY|nr:hypothetical protein Cgig2_000328 [Carnegiea gigantea]
MERVVGEGSSAVTQPDEGVSAGINIDRTAIISIENEFFKHKLGDLGEKDRRFSAYSFRQQKNMAWLSYAISLLRVGDNGSFKGRLDRYCAGVEWLVLFPLDEVINLKHWNEEITWKIQSKIGVIIHKLKGLNCIHASKKILEDTNSRCKEGLFWAQCAKMNYLKNGQMQVMYLHNTFPVILDMVRPCQELFTPQSFSLVSFFFFWGGGGGWKASKAIINSVHFVSVDQIY